MIVFDLACAGGGHVFEAWFGSTDDYETQRQRGLVECPVCGDKAIDKAVMAPRLAAKGNQRAVAVPKPSTSTPQVMPPPEGMKAFLGAMAEVQRKILAKSEHVGSRFADEARAIHHGESEERSIHGVATPAEARGLIEDGIEIAPLPFPVRPPHSDN